MNRIFLILTVVSFTFFACSTDDGVEPDVTTNNTQEVSDTTNVDTNEVVSCIKNKELFNATINGFETSQAYSNGSLAIDGETNEFDALSFFFKSECAPHNETLIAINNFDGIGKYRDDALSNLHADYSVVSADPLIIYDVIIDEDSYVDVTKLDTINNVMSVNINLIMVSPDEGDTILLQSSSFNDMEFTR